MTYERAQSRQRQGATDETAHRFAPRLGTRSDTVDEAPRRADQAGACSLSAGCSCVSYPSDQLHLCELGRVTAPSSLALFAGQPLQSSVHTARARKLICHPKEWSEFVTIICSGWALSSVTLADGRRQILSFLLPGDVVSCAAIFAPLAGRAVEAVTDVTYRRFKRADIKTAMLANTALMEKFMKSWAEEKESDGQLIVDLGRRFANERVARQILYVMNKLSKRGMAKNQTMFFPLRRKHIADAVGVTLVHAGKVLANLQKSGLIAISNRSLTITNAAELRRLADWD
jgi:CRP/FNR family transcriptional regulator